MNWTKAFRISGYLGTAVCGVFFFAKSCSKSKPGTILGTVSASATDQVHDQNVCSVTSSSESQVTPCVQTEDESIVDVACLKLKQVHVYFRHGARLPLHLTPGLEEVAYQSDFFLRTPPHFSFNHVVVILPDKRENEKLSEMEELYRKTILKGGGYAGNLTTFGQQQVYELGLRLRRCYIVNHKLVNPCYKPSEVYVQSTNIDRTIASARCVLAGMFGRDVLNQKGPVVIPVSLENDEVLYPNPPVCDLLRKVNHAALIHSDSIPGMKEDRILIQGLLGLGPDEEKKIDFIAMRDDLVARTAHGYPYPEKLCCYKDMIEYNATKQLYFAMCGQHHAERVVVTRLGGGPALHLAVSQMAKAVEGDERLFKIYLYSTHDSTMVTLLEALGIFDWRWPPFACDLRLELYEDCYGQTYVQVLYCGEVKIMRGQRQPIISWPDFSQLVNPYLISRGPEYDSICASDMIEKMSSSLLQHDKGEKMEETKKRSEVPAGM